MSATRLITFVVVVEVKGSRETLIALLVGRRSMMPCSLLWELANGVLRAEGYPVIGGVL
jgi:hypothetical protein